MTLIKGTDAADLMLRTMKSVPTGVYGMKDGQADLVKEWWDELHIYDSEHTYSFSEDFKHLKKYKIFKID